MAQTKIIVRYVSPLQLIDLPAATSYDKKDLLLAKKKMLAELDLAGGTTVTIKGKELSKNDILQLFDELGNEDDLLYHGAIANDKGLIDFLEGRTDLQDPVQFLSHPGYRSPKFNTWIAPYFYYAFTRYAALIVPIYSTSEVKPAQPDSKAQTAWKNLLGSRLLMDHQHEEMAWSKIEALFEPTLETIKALADNEANKNQPGFVAKAEALCDHLYINLMLQLPDQRFGAFRDEFAFSMMQLLILVFNTRVVDNQRYATETMLNVKLLAYDEYNKTQIQNKYDEMTGLIREANPGRRKSSSSSNSGGYSWTGIGVVLFVLIRWLITCNNSSSHSNSYTTYTSPTYERSTTTVEPAEEKPIIYEIDPPVTALDTFISELRKASYADGIATTSRTLKSGEDPYSVLWSKKPFLSDVKKVPQLRFKITNGSAMDVIVFVANKGKVSSVYIPYMDSATIKLTKGTNILYLYFGRNFKTGKGFAVSPSNPRAPMATGLFTEYTGPNINYLSNPLTQIVGENDTEGGILEIWEERGKVVHELASKEAYRRF